MEEAAFSEYFLCNFSDNVKSTDLPHEALQQHWFGNYSVEQLIAAIRNWLQQDKNQVTDALELLSNCIQLLLTFVQHNFTGPYTGIADTTTALAYLKLDAYDPFEQLKASGEEINPNVKNGELLVIAQEMLHRLQHIYPNDKVLLCWQLRALCIHQHILDDLANVLYGKFKKIADMLLQQVDKFVSKELQALVQLEVANGYLQFHRSDIAAHYLNQLCDKLQVTLNAEGLLGMRTKFQQKPLPQLCLKVVQANSEMLPAANSSNSNTELPKLLLLEDDTRLERIHFIEPQDNEVMTLPSVLQVLVLSKVKQLKRSQPRERLADEILEPYTQTLLYQSNGPLQVRLAALLLNCVQESGMRRTVERSWKQCEECVQMLNNPEKYVLRERLSYSFASFLEPKWRIQLQLCDLLRSLGMTKTALDIYLQIQAWEQVIECYTSLELRHKAAEIIRQELAKKPTALLYCLLGDAVDEPKYYEEAWKFSKHTSGKAQAYWGNYYYRRSEYEQAIEHFQKSIEINMLQEKILLRYGYCAIQLERWQTAVHAYISYTHLEPNGFESWNNLAKALIKLGDKQRAHKVLGESLKCNYNNWKVWENFMLVSVDTGHFEDAIRAYNRLTEIKIHFLDLEVLTLIIHGVIKLILEIGKEQIAHLHKKAVQLMAQQCIKHGNEPLVWELAALIAKTPMKKAEQLVKSYRAYTAKDLNWYTKDVHVIKALKLCVEICELSLAAIDEHAKEESEAMITSQLNSARLSATSCTNALKKTTNMEPSEEHLKLLNELNEVLSRVLKIIKERMAQN